jgi:hypothetical protein
MKFMADTATLEQIFLPVLNFISHFRFTDTSYPFILIPGLTEW